MVDALSDIEETSRLGMARRPYAWWPAGLIASSAVLLLLITSGEYDYHRDELYFRMLGEHPQWGYVDQAPFTPMLVRLGIEMFGDTLWAIRVPVAVLLGFTALVLAAIAREVGGGAGAQALASAGVFGVFPLSSAHVNSTAAADLLVWTGVLFFVVRALLWGRPRAWLGAGTVAGLGLWNKDLVLLLLGCLALGLLLAGQWRVLRSRHLWFGVAAAVVIGAPNLAYQVMNGFPQWETAEAVAANSDVESRLQLLPLQFVLPALVPMWLAGLVVLVRDPRLRPLRALAVAYPLMLVVLLITAGQPDRPAGLLLGLHAIGAVAVARWVTGRPARRTLTGVTVVASSVAAVAASLPVVPEEDLAGWLPARANRTIADQIGWREYVWQIGAVWAGLSATDQARSVLFTGDYGVAGALARYGPSLRLPEVYSGHNALHAYGPPPDSKKVVIAVLDTPPDALGTCTARATLSNRAGVTNAGTGLRVYLCRMDRPWSVAWPELRHSD